MSSLIIQDPSFSLLSKTPELAELLLKLQIKSEHEAQYKKNYSLVREKFKKHLNRELSLNAATKAYFIPDKKK